MCSKVDDVPIDDLNVMARVGWRFPYDRPQDRKLRLMDLTSLYFLDQSDGSPRIFAAATREGEAALRQEGPVS